jgi:hypothetical protein
MNNEYLRGYIEGKKDGNRLAIYLAIGFVLMFIAFLGKCFL